MGKPIIFKSRWGTLKMLTVSKMGATQFIVSAGIDSGGFYTGYRPVKITSFQQSRQDCYSDIKRIYPYNQISIYYGKV